MEPKGGAEEALTLISDLDDTIKISHTQSKVATVYRGLFRSSAFTGMAQLYAELLAADPDSKFYVVSSSPPQIRRKIEFFLVKNGFPEAEIVLRDWLRQTSIVKYKLRSILELVERAHWPVLLIGDDTEHDPEVFAHVLKRHPGKVAARYVRAVKGRALPEGSVAFFTAFDIACAELAAGRLRSEQAMRVGEIVLQAEKGSRLIPWFSILPPARSLPFEEAVNSQLATLWRAIQTRIVALPRKGRRKK